MRASQRAVIVQSVLCAVASVTTTATIFLLTTSDTAANIITNPITGDAINYDKSK